MQNFNQLGRVEAIRRLYGGTAYSPFPVKAVRSDTEGKLVFCSSRVFLEGIDFDLVYFPLKHLGYKSVAGVTGELYASLSRPESLQVVLGISAKLDFEKISELWSGVIAAAQEFGYSAVDLDLKPSQNGLVISISAAGQRTGAESPAAESKDLLCVSGALGAAYCGLRLLERGRERFDKGGGEEDADLEKYRMLLAAYLKPELPVNLAETLESSGITPSAAYFVERGLADTLLRLTSDTGLGAKVYADRIPFEGGSFAVGKELGFDPVSAAMNGGEDYRILLAVPISQYEKLRRDLQTFDIIGHLAQKDVGAVLVSPDGLEHMVTAPGWPAQDND